MSTETETKTETALAELRIMFPDLLISIRVRDYAKAREWFIDVGFVFQGLTLEECMAQVRKWKESQS